MNYLFKLLIIIYLFGQLYLSWYFGYNGHPYYYVVIIAFVFTIFAHPTVKLYLGSSPSWGYLAYLIIFLIFTFIYTLVYFMGNFIGPGEFILDYKNLV